MTEAEVDRVARLIFEAMTRHMAAHPNLYPTAAPAAAWDRVVPLYAKDVYRAAARRLIEAGVVAPDTGKRGRGQ